MSPPTLSPLGLKLVDIGLVDSLLALVTHREQTGGVGVVQTLKAVPYLLRLESVRMLLLQSSFVTDLLDILLESEDMLLANLIMAILPHLARDPKCRME